jgi:RHS repeat-associated protein
VNPKPSAPTTEYAYRAGEMLIQADASDCKWLVSDHLGSPRIILGTSGSLADTRRRDFMPFGEDLGAGQFGRTTALGYEATGTPSNPREKFATYERDDETGLDFAQARYYQSRLGRFTSVDPLMASGNPINPKTWNRYSYCLNNPLRLFDPTGLIATSNFQADYYDDQNQQEQQKKEKKSTLRQIFDFFFDDYYADPGQNSTLQLLRDPLALIINPGKVGASVEVGIADTQLASAILRGATEESLGVSGVKLYITPTTYQELRNTDGVAKEALDAGLKAARIDILSPPPSLVQQAAREIQPLLNVGGINPAKASRQLMDPVILAEAKAAKMPLFTNNVNDFQRVAAGGGRLAERLGVQVIRTNPTPAGLPRLSTVLKNVVKRIF